MSTPSDSHYPQGPDSQALVLKEQGIEEGFVEKLRSLKYTCLLEAKEKDSTHLLRVLGAGPRARACGRIGWENWLVAAQAAGWHNNP